MTLKETPLFEGTIFRNCRSIERAKTREKKSDYFPRRRLAGSESLVCEDVSRFRDPSRGARDFSVKDRRSSIVAARNRS